MTTRRPVESFSFPVEKIKQGYYTDAYFMRSEEILNGDNYHPRVLMLDEPVEGLAPVIVEEIVSQIKSIKQAGVTILLVEQNLEVCTQLADRHFIIEQGAIVYEGSNADFVADENVKDRYLGVGV